MLNYHIESDPEFENQLRQRARREIHEIPKEVHAHLISFTRWIEASPHLTFPTEPALMIPFLRHAKYIHSKAQARLDNFCTLRASQTQGIPQWFEPFQLNDPIIDEYLSAGVLIPLGRTENDIQILLVRLAAWNKKSYGLDIFKRLNIMDFDRLVLDSCVQIAGYGVLFDMTGASTKDLFAINDMKAMKMDMKIWHDCYPLRVKHLIYFNEPRSFDALFKVTEVWLSSKIRDRILRVKNDIGKAFKKVSGLKTIMPPEYGGHNLPLNELIRRNSEEFHKFYSQPSPWTTINVDESKRPEWAKSYMRSYKDINEQASGCTGTYVQLDPDD